MTAGETHTGNAKRLPLIWRTLKVHRDLDRRRFWTWLVLAFGGQATVLAITVTDGFIVGGIPEAAAQGWGSPAARQVGLALLMMTLLDFGTAACHGYSWQLAALLGLRNRLRFEQRLVAALVRPPGVAHVHDDEVLDAARAADNVWVQNILEGLGSVGGNKLLGFGATALIAWQHPVAGLVLALGWLQFGRWAWRRAAMEAGVVSGHAGALRRAQAVRDMGTDAAAAKEVRLFGLGPFFTRRFVDEWRNAMQTVWSERKAATKGTALNVGIVGLAHAVAIGLVARGGLDGSISLVGVGIVLQALPRAARLGGVPYGHYEIEYGLHSIEYLEKLERLVAERCEELPGDAPATDPRSAIRFEKVGFRYPGSGDDVLADLDLEIPVGSSLAIVGVNGAGKTTIVQLLCRLRDPVAGRITVDGTDLRTIEPRSWQRRVATVSQDSLRLPLTVADNVAGAWDLTPEQLERAASAAGATNVVAHLTNGWDTLLARELEGGTELSGGQWQRIALARAMGAAAAGCPLLVLDEPTAHLDARAEADLYERFLDLTAGCTTVLISHRFSTVRRADRIVVLDHGRVAEQGTHDELLAAGGAYAEMFRVQAARFADDAPVRDLDDLDDMDDLDDLDDDVADPDDGAREEVPA